MKKTLPESILVGQMQPLAEESESFSGKTRLKLADAAVLLETDKSLVKGRAKTGIALKAFPVLDILWPALCL